MKLGDWISLLCFVTAAYILWEIRPLLLLTFAAVVVAIALNSLTDQLRKFKIPRKFAIPTALLLTTLIAALFILGIVPPFIEQFRLLVELIVRFSQTLPDRIAQLQTNLPDRIRLPDLSEFLVWITAPDSAVIDVFGNFFSFFNSSLQTALQALFVLILAIMMLVNPSAYLTGIILLFPSFYRRRAREIFGKCESALGNWLGGIIISSLFVFTFSFVGLIVLGVDLAFAHALLAGILNFIPNIGPTLSMGFPVIVALLSDEPWKAIAVVGLYVVIQQVESYWVTPTIMAHQVSLLPAFTLVAQIFFATTFGFLGLLLALPLTVVTKTWIDELLIQDILNHWQIPQNTPFAQRLAQTATPNGMALEADQIDIHSVNIHPPAIAPQNTPPAPDPTTPPATPPAARK
ncbi:MAG: AI-2E family transporter [Phormidesmis sp.]